MDSCDEENDEDWGQAWDKDIHEAEQVSYGTHQPNLPSGDSKSTDVGTSTLLQQHKKVSSTTSLGLQVGSFDTKEPGDSAAMSLVSHMKLTDIKAGMEGFDRAKINQIILEASKGSRYFENELKREEQMNKRIDDQMKKITRLSEMSMQHGISLADNLLSELESTRDLTRTIVHIDMDAFYAAVEMRDDPQLRNRPMAVGGNSMLSTSNYLARRFGVRAAMPGFIAKKLCPGLVIVPVNSEKYQAVSKDIRSILSLYDPNMCPMSLDEAYLDITEYMETRKDLTIEERTFHRKLTDGEVCSCHQNIKIQEKSNVQADTFHKGDKSQENILDSSSDGNSPQAKVETSDSVEDGHNKTDVSLQEALQAKRCDVCDKPKAEETEEITFGLSIEETVNEMRFRIRALTQLTASAGIAPNMMLAKVCSDRNKPNGQYIIQPTRPDVMDFIHQLPIRKVGGIGKVAEKMLSALGVTACTDLYNKRGLLYLLYSKISFNYFMRICLGIGSTKVEKEGERKSMSVERTFNEIHRPAELYKKCYELCEALAEDLKKEQMLGKTVTLKLKQSNFEVWTRANSVVSYISAMESIYNVARDILKLEIQAVAPNPLRLRLMGVRMSNLVSQNNMAEAKQETITGLFRKLQAKWQAGSPPGSPIKDVSHYYNTDPGSSIADLESSNVQEEFINAKVKSEPLCNAFNTEYTNFKVNQHLSNVNGSPGSLKEIDSSISSHFTYRTDLMEKVAHDEKPNLEIQSAADIFCEVLSSKGSHDVESGGLVSVCSEQKQESTSRNRSAFGYVSHSKNDFIGLRNAEILKDYMVNDCLENTSATKMTTGSEDDPSNILETSSIHLSSTELAENMKRCREAYVDDFTGISSFNCDELESGESTSSRNIIPSVIQTINNNDYDKQQVSTQIGDMQQVSTQLGDKQQVSTQLGDKQQVSTQLGDKQQVSTQLGDKQQVSTQLGDKQQVSTQLGDKQQVSTQLGDKQQVSTQLGDKQQVSTQLGDKQQVSTQLGDKQQVSTQLGDKQQVSTQLGDKQQVSTQLGDKQQVSTQLGDKQQVSTQLGDKQQVSTQLGDKQQVSTQLGDKQQVSRQHGKFEIPDSATFVLTHSELSENLTDDTLMMNDSAMASSLHNNPEESLQYECPVCFQSDHFSDLRSFTSHVDNCLSTKTIADEHDAAKLKVSSQRSISKSTIGKPSRPPGQDTCGHESDIAGTSTQVHHILICPICNAPQRKSDLSLFNQHVDGCLNRQTIREMIQPQHTAKRSPSDSWSPNYPKRRKTDQHSSQSAKGTLLGFFKSKNN